MQLTYLTICATALFAINSAAGACSGGVNVCCGSSSVGCSGNICKACCGQTCGCFYEKGSTCNSQTTPCVDVTKPDFATTNGECVAPRSTSVSSSSGSGASKSSLCTTLSSGFLKKLLNC